MSEQPVAGSSTDDVELVTVEIADGTIHAVDRMDNAVDVETTGWDEIDPRLGLRTQQDAVVGGRVSELSVQAQYPTLTRLDEAEGESVEQVDICDSCVLDSGQFELGVDTPVQTVVRFAGPATVERTESDDIVLSFDQPSPVSIGFASMLRYPRHTVTVPRTNEGLATAMSQFPAALKTTSPMRSTTDGRQHPPAIEFGETLDIPDAVRELVPDSDFVLKIPDRRDLLFQSAPLAYYLGASVTVHDGSPVLAATDGSFEYRFDGPPRFQYEAMALLRRVYLLDNVLWNGTEGDESLRERHVIEALGLDEDRLLEASLPERLRTYMAAPFDRVSSTLPEWHTVSYVEPTFENAKALPGLMRYLSAVFDPDTYPTGGAASIPAEFHDTVPDRLLEASCHGSAVVWLADAPRPDARPFVACPRTFTSAPRYLDRDEGADAVVVACNDTSRRAEATALADRYRTYTPDTVAIHEHTELSRAELSDLFERGADFLHFVGDVTDGFDCRDGRLAPEDLPDSNIRLVFLDGARTADTTTACIERGSMGGFAVEGDSLLAEETRECVTGLLVRGFTAEQAVRYAVAHTDTDASLVAVGDGFQQLVRTMSLWCTQMTVEPLGPNRFALNLYPYIPEAGFIWRPEHVDRPPQLCAKPFELTVSGPELTRLIETENLVPIYDGHVYWRPESDFFNPLV
ncbi:hypothetical protein [Haloarchaeobius iranensis]|uniref:Uncharacterized protein n=1 Tax=Haloarchaeobius iranensis TaxID=996166 RepID=A0A1G9ZE33_9EURY|nr:hypothetical protein [Haloarchaeobius iranensis]SDN18723.1 hypothetical protein SAMN05192554_11940 [Haloarchaeobius iranensis]